MFVTCPRCKETLQFDGDCRGMDVECPSCRLQFKVPNVTRLAKAPAQKPAGKNSYFLSFLLGLLFNVPGVFIALAISGRDGAMAALRGILAEFIIAIGLYFALSFAF